MQEYRLQSQREDLLENGSPFIFLSEYQTESSADYKSYEFEKVGGTIAVKNNNK